MVAGALVGHDDYHGGDIVTAIREENDRTLVIGLVGGRFMSTKPHRSKCSTRRLATIADMSSPALWTRLRPLLTQDGWVRDYSPRR